MVSLSTHLSRLMLRVNMDRVSRWTLKSNLMITCMSDIFTFSTLEPSSSASSSSAVEMIVVVVLLFRHI